MKFTLVILALVMSSMGFAKEIDTDCAAINGNREKIIKTATVKSSVKSGATAQ